MQGQLIEAVPQIRDLGFIIDPHLKFSSHCKHIADKALRVSHMMLRALQTTNPATLLSAYQIYVIPVLESATTVFSPYQISDIQVIERVQDYLTRRIFSRAYGLTSPRPSSYGLSPPLFVDFEMLAESSPRMA